MAKKVIDSTYFETNLQNLVSNFLDFRYLKVVSELPASANSDIVFLYIGETIDTEQVKYYKGGLYNYDNGWAEIPNRLSAEVAKKQNKTLETALVVSGSSYTTVEDVLSALNNSKLDIATTEPSEPADGDIIMYVGAATTNLPSKGIYVYNENLSKWNSQIIFGEYAKGTSTTLDIGRNSLSTVGDYSSAEGYDTVASGRYSHSEGNSSEATEESAHAEGQETTARGYNAHSEGNRTDASGNYSHAEGQHSMATSNSDHAEGYYTEANGGASHAEGNYTKASGSNAHAEGNNTTASGLNSHSEGGSSEATAEYAHAEGEETIAKGYASHAEGSNTMAISAYAHAEGSDTKANAMYTHAEGSSTTASGQFAHAEGLETKASGSRSHAEGFGTTARSLNSHAQNNHTIAGYANQTAMGTYNDNKSTNLLEVGNGADDNNRSNAVEVTADGDLLIKNGGVSLYGLDENKELFGAKNLLPLTLDNLKAINTTGTWSGNAYTLNGVTFTVNTDGLGSVTDITVNGTSTTTTVFRLTPRFGNFMSNTKYYISGAPTNTNAAYYQLYNLSTSGGISNILTDDYELTYTSEMTMHGLVLRVDNGVSITSQAISPMIRLATDPNNTYRPYAMSNAELTQRLLALEARLSSNISSIELET